MFFLEQISFVRERSKKVKKRGDWGGFVGEIAPTFPREEGREMKSDIEEIESRLAVSAQIAQVTGKLPDTSVDFVARGSVRLEDKDWCSDPDEDQRLVVG